MWAVPVAVVRDVMRIVAMLPVAGTLLVACIRALEEGVVLPSSFAVVNVLYRCQDAFFSIDMQPDGKAV